MRPVRSRCRPCPDATNPGDSSGEAIPVPIPNTEVKLSSAEDTERAAFRENRSSPGFLRFLREPRAVVFVATGGILGVPMLRTSAPTRLPPGRAGDHSRVPVPPVGERCLARIDAGPRAPLHGRHARGDPRPRQATPPVPGRRARDVRDLPGRDRPRCRPRFRRRHPPEREHTGRLASTGADVAARP